VQIFKKKSKHVNRFLKRVFTFPPSWCFPHQRACACWKTGASPHLWKKIPCDQAAKHPAATPSRFWTRGDPTARKKWRVDSQIMHGLAEADASACKPRNAGRFPPGFSFHRWMYRWQKSSTGCTRTLLRPGRTGFFFPLFVACICRSPYPVVIALRTCATHSSETGSRYS
jgi:hypothetical protein